MTSVGRIGRTTTPYAAPRPAGGTPFSMPAPAPAAAAPAASVASVSLLGLQEAGQGMVRDRDARRHGHAMLDALAELQRALLGEEGGDTLARLERLVRDAPAPADPALALVQRMVLQRTAVELARRRVAAA